MITHFSPSQQA